jgi:hypothetical protein
VFLVAAEKSGTTLLRLMLDGHPQIAWPCEFDYALEWPESHDAAPPDLFDFWVALAESRQARQARVQIDPALAFPELVRSLYDQLGARTRKPIVGVTLHRHFERLVQIWPEASFIYLVRDGRDVARSHVEMGWSGNVWSGARAWLEAERSWRALAARIPAERRIEVRYEALVAHPARELARLCAFLDVEYSPDMLEYPARSSYEAPDPRLAERWREQLSPRELALLERAMGAELRARDYAPSRVGPAWVPAPRRLALRLGDRFGRMRFRMRRYGVALWLRRQLAKRFDLRPLRGVLERTRLIDAVLLR